MSIVKNYYSGVVCDWVNSVIQNPDIYQIRAIRNLWGWEKWGVIVERFRTLEKNSSFEKDKWWTKGVKKFTRYDEEFNYMGEAEEIFKD